MCGTPPAIFDGNKKEYTSWKTQLRLYQLVNRNHPVMTNVVEKTLNAMGFVRGLNVATWIEDQLGLLEQQTVQWGDEDP
jgi:hypothetical protein